MNRKHYNSILLAKWRNALGKTQDEIALILEVDRNTISRAETGKAASYELLAALCNIYQKSMHELIYSQPVVTA